MTRPLTRRQALTLLGAGVGTAALGACAGGSSSGGDTASATSTPPSSTPTTASPSTASAGIDAGRFAGAASCTAAVEQTEGPYYLDVDQIRSDIREDREGVPLRVAARVLDADGCTPIPDAVFEIWHCDAAGLYSGFEAASTGRGNARDDSRYLRGAQVTNAEGIAVITTIFPGWYEGRTVHIHAKVALTNRELLTTQLYFDEGLTAEVLSRQPYAARTGRRTTNASDGFYRSSTMLTMEPDGDGYLGLITIGVEA